MEILDLVTIGSKVKINVDLSKDRLSNKTLEAIKVSSTCEVKEFRLTDGKGIGIFVELSNGEIEWFFENEIEILDNEGNIIKREEKVENNFIKDLLENISYSKKSDFKNLINPLNFFSWLIYSFKDIF